MNNLKLTIELVPSSSWMNNVRSVLSTKQWDILRKSVYEQAWNLCEICGGEGLKHPVECHEVWSYDDKTHVQKLERMIALCPNCHQVKHFGLAQLQGREERVKKHFIKVNNLKKVEAEKYIKQAFLIWAERSSQSWTLDLSYLNRYRIDIEKGKYGGRPT